MPEPTSPEPTPQETFRQIFRPLEISRWTWPSAAWRVSGMAAVEAEPPKLIYPISFAFLIPVVGGVASILLNLFLQMSMSRRSRI